MEAQARQLMADEQDVARCKKDTDGVVVGSTFDASFKPATDIAAALDESAGASAPDVPIHADGVSVRRLARPLARD